MQGTRADVGGVEGLRKKKLKHPARGPSNKEVGKGLRVSRSPLENQALRNREGGGAPYDAKNQNKYVDEQRSMRRQARGGDY